MPTAPKSPDSLAAGLGSAPEIGLLCADVGTRLALRCLDQGNPITLHRWSLRGEALLKDELDLLEQTEGVRLEEKSAAWELSISPTSLAQLRASAPLGKLLVACTNATLRPTAKPLIMGIVNVTPDSFSDGGQWLDPIAAINHGLQLVADGADVLDIGGESSRPGASPIDEIEELRRVIPVIEGLAARTSTPLSIDSTKSAVARAALDAGASWVNDISAGLQEPQMLPLVAERSAVFVAMHRKGDSLKMQTAPSYQDCLGEVCEHLRERAAACLTIGIASDKLILDPGIGFGKTLEHNLDLMGRLRELRSLGAPLLVGPSRKAFIEQVNAAAEGADGQASLPFQRLGGTAAAISLCIDRGAEVFRVHDVRMMVEAARVAHALSSPKVTP